MSKKFTMASAKSFIRKNKDKLLINVKSEFDGMIDGLAYHHEGFKAIVLTMNNYEHTQGVAGVWFVGGSRDYFKTIEVEDKVVGFDCHNCCGHFILKVA